MSGLVITKVRLIDILYHKFPANSFHSKAQVLKLMDILLNTFQENFEKGNSISIKNFGKWKISHKNKRPGRNPHTGEKIEITSRKVITFIPSDYLRSKINNKKVRNR